MPYLLFFEKAEKLKLSSAANYRWRLRVKGIRSLLNKQLFELRLDNDFSVKLKRRVLFKNPK